MKTGVGLALLPMVLLTLRVSLCACGGESFRVATYNLESYLDAATPTRAAKTAERNWAVRAR
jgi:hypothetical protein